MNKIKIMVSSTVTDLLDEREAISEELSKIPFVEIVGAYPFSNSSTSSNSYGYTTQLAKSCDLYILILGKRFGFETESGKTETSQGKSATEIEFDESYKQDPTKILIFQKEFPKCEKGGVELTAEQIKDSSYQKMFIEKATDYYSGFWRTTFKDVDRLKELVNNSFYTWLIEKSNLGKDMTYIDHFIRLANKLKPEPNSQLIYSITDNDVELEYTYFKKTIPIHISRQSIYEGFWEQVSKLQTKLNNPNLIIQS